MMTSQSLSAAVLSAVDSEIIHVGPITRDERIHNAALYAVRRNLVALFASGPTEPSAQLDLDHVADAIGCELGPYIEPPVNHRVMKAAEAVMALLDGSES